MADAFVFNPASIPHLLFAVAVLGLIFSLLLSRGDTLIRATLLSACAASVAWFTSMWLLLNMGAYPANLSLSKFMVGCWSLFGGATTAFVVALNGSLDRHKWAVIALGAVCVFASLLTWATDLVVDGTRELPWGGFYPSAASILLVIQAALMAIPPLIGLYLANRNPSRRRHQFLDGYGFWLGILATITAASEALLCYGIGLFPFSPIFGLLTVGVLAQALLRTDLLRARGFDRASAYEVFMTFLLIPVVFTVIWASQPNHLAGGFTLVLLVLVPLFGGTQAAALMVRKHISSKRVQRDPDADMALEQLAEQSLDFRSDLELAFGLVETIEEHTRLTKVQLYVVHDERTFRRAGESDVEQPIEIGDKLLDWLIDNRSPLHGSDLPVLRLHGVRAQLEKLLDELDSDIIVPLSDRDKLVGIIATAPPIDDRALTDDEIQMLRDIGKTAAKSLTFINLFVEAEERIEIANELKLAADIRGGRSVGEVVHAFEYARVMGQYIPAAQFGGDWWSTYELPDKRVLIVIGDVAGRGVPAALVSSTAMAACHTAQAVQGANCEVHTLLELLNDAVRMVGGDKYEMSCFIALIDGVNRTVVFANGGHRRPYLARPPRQGEGPAKLHALESRGSQLGITNLVIQSSQIDFEDGDVLVFFGDAIVAALDTKGQRYGEDRLRALISTQVVDAETKACQVIMDDLRAHCADRPIEDDITLVVARLGGRQAM